MARGKESVKKGIWYLGKKKKKNKRNLYLKQFSVEEEEKDDEKKNTATTTTGCSKKSCITKRTNLLHKVGKNDQTKFTKERYHKKK